MHFKRLLAFIFLENHKPIWSSKGDLQCAITFMSLHLICNKIFSWPITFGYFPGLFITFGYPTKQ